MERAVNLNSLRHAREVFKHLLFEIRKICVTFIGNER